MRPLGSASLGSLRKFPSVRSDLKHYSVVWVMEWNAVGSFHNGGSGWKTLCRLQIYHQHDSSVTPETGRQLYNKGLRSSGLVSVQCRVFEALSSINSLLVHSENNLNVNYNQAALWGLPANPQPPVSRNVHRNPRELTHHLEGTSPTETTDVCFYNITDSTYNYTFLFLAHVRWAQFLIRKEHIYCCL